MDVRYTTDLSAVDWQEMKNAVAADHFDNGRTADQLRRSFEASHVACIAYCGAIMAGTARAPSDGGCNA